MGRSCLATRLGFACALVGAALIACGQDGFGTESAHAFYDAVEQDGFADTIEPEIEVADVLATADTVDTGQSDIVDGLPLDAALDVETLIDILPDASIDVPLPTDATNLVLPGACIPKGATATTIGDATPTPTPFACAPSACDLCPTPFECTCKGDGGTACAWAPMQHLNTPRGDAAGVTGSDGKFYVFGGFSGTMPYNVTPTDDPLTPGIQADGEVYDPATNTWTALPMAPIYPGLFPKIAWGDGKLYVAGSNEDVDLSIAGTIQNPPYARYDPVTNTWFALPAEGSPGGAGWLDSLHWLNGKLVALGAVGWQTPGGMGNLPGPPAVYDPETNQWTKLPEMPPPGAAKLTPPHAPVVLGTKLVWINYLDPSDSAATGVVLDGKTWTWSLFNVPDCAPQLVSGSAAASADRIAIWGSSWPGAENTEMWLLQLDPVVWTAVHVPAWMDGYDATSRTIVAVPDGRFIVAVYHGYQPETANAIYDPVKDSWVRIAEFDAPKLGQVGSLVGFAGNQLLVVGGFFNTPSQKATSMCDRIWIPPP